MKSGWEQRGQGCGGESSLGVACLGPLSSWPSLEQMLEKQEEDWPVHIQARAN